MKIMVVVGVNLLLLNISAQYQVQWHYTTPATKWGDPITSIVATDNGVLAGTYEGKIYYLNDMTQPVFTSTVPNWIGAIGVTGNSFNTYGTHISTFNFLGQKISSIPIENGANFFSLTTDGFYGVHKYKYLTKYNLKGEVRWRITIDEKAQNLKYAVGKSSVFVYTYNGSEFISRYDTSGALIWRIGGASEGMISDEKDNLYTFSAGGGNWVVSKLNKDGSLVWQHVDSIQSGSAALKGDSLLLGGSTSLNGKLVSTIKIISANTGSLILQQFFDFYGTSTNWENIYDIAYLGNDLYCAVGYYYNVHAIVKLTDARFVGIKETSVSQHRFSIFPNPSSSAFTVKMGEVTGQPAVVRVSNGMGQLIIEKQRHGMETEFDVNLSAYARGIYFIQLTAGGNTEVQKIILE